MNKNKRFKHLLNQNKLRNAFIPIKHQLAFRSEMIMKKISILAFAVIAIIVVSSLSIAVSSAAALPATDKLNMSSNKPVQKSWVRINGVINNWGTEDVNGLLQTRARTTLLASEDKRQLASATAMWTNSTSRPINSVKAKENFTYTFYTARLNNASISEFSLDNSDYFLNGTWNLYTVTSNITIITNENNTIISVHRESDTKASKAYGELNITDNWTKFTLSIDDQEPLTGSVFRSMTRQIEFNPFKMIEDSSTKVTRADLSEMVKCFHAMPGWGNYDAQMDFNGNFKIDIADLSTVAANM